MNREQLKRGGLQAYELGRLRFALRTAWLLASAAVVCALETGARETHDPREATRIAQRIVVLEGGRIVQHGSLDELATGSATPFVGAFVRAARGANA